MTKATTAQYQVNAAHGTDVSVWVCESSGVIIGPCVFMQAVCPPRFPLLVPAPWASPGLPPGPFKKSGEISLLYGECGPVGPRPEYLHLFSAGAAATPPFERETALGDWQFPVRIAGLVVLLDKKSDDAAANRFFNMFTASSPAANRTLVWAKAQHLPVVVAAMGYPPANFPEAQFRRRYGLPPEIAVVPGPALLGEAELKARRGETADQADGGGLFGMVFGSRKLGFDPTYARQILGALSRMIAAAGA